MKKLVLYGMILGIVIAAASIIGATTYSQQTQAEPMIVQTISGSMGDVSLEMLGEHAKYAIAGKVVSITPIKYVDSDRRAEKIFNKLFQKNQNILLIDEEILSDVKIKVKEDLFGKYDKKFITLRIPGGQTETQKTIHKLSPEFVVGDRIIVFVGIGDSYSISENNYTVLGLMQGTIRLTEDNKVVSKFAPTDEMTEKEMKNIIKLLKNRT